MKEIIPLFVVIPLAAAFLNSLFGRKFRRFSDIISIITTFLAFIVSIKAVLLVHQYNILVYKVGGWVPPRGISLVLDGLSSFMLVTVNLVSFLICLFSINYMEKYTAKWKFYTLFLLMLAGMNGVIIAGDLFNLFVFLEIASVASYALVAYGTEAEELEASFKYTIMSSVASSFILLGIAFLYSYTSSLNMADIAAALNGRIDKVVVFVSILFFTGFGLKAALVPFHTWLPDAHPSAPAPISAALSGILIKTLGLYSLFRIFYNVLGVNFLFSKPFIFLGTLSVLVGAILAIGQKDFKRLLAYSSINQIGYIILGVGLNSYLGILGALFHLFNHSIFKSLLFLNSGAVEYSTGTRNLDEMGGLRKKMPVTSSTNLIASMSISGVPPFSGFFSKFIIILACVQAGFYGYAFWAVLGSILTLAYFLKVQKLAFFGDLKEQFKDIKEVPFFMLFSMIILAIICIIGSFLILPAFAKYFLDPALSVLQKGLRYSAAVTDALK